jgi:uncharacterized Ntn-hydrolase superfamily protein
MTFSIVAWDPNSESGAEWGVAVASKFLAVGAAVPWAAAPVGAVATQALANLAYGPDGLVLLRAGKRADAVVAELTGADEEREHRQLGVVDAGGGAATYTGTECYDWAGGRTGDGYTCQGNILTGPEVVDAMCEGFENASGELAVKLLAALHAGDRAGGDKRGRQSASVMVVREGGGYGGTIDRAVDLRVDDHPDPVPELKRLFDLNRLYFPRPEDLDFVPLDDALKDEISGALAAAGYPGELKEALFAYVGTENLEERWSDDDVIEKGILEHLRSR